MCLARLVKESILEGQTPFVKNVTDCLETEPEANVSDTRRWESLTLDNKRQLLSIQVCYQLLYRYYNTLC